MKLPNSLCGIGRPPSSWLATVDRISNFVFRGPIPGRKPDIGPSGNAGVRREITAICEQRRIRADAWVSLACESAEAEKAVREALAKIPVVPGH